MAAACVMMKLLRAAAIMFQVPVGIWVCVCSDKSESAIMSMERVGVGVAQIGVENCN
jgi:hypothetical protein